MAKLVPLFSSSKGNSYYLQGNDSAILIDAGRSCKQIENALLINDLDMKNVRNVFITHEHSDHVGALKVLASRYDLTVYATKGTLEALYEQDKISASTRCIEITDKIETDDFKVERVDTSHDSRESCGFLITTPDNKKCAIVTDTGFLTQSAINAISCSKCAVIESNHDVDMLKSGGYPYILKKRILSMTGHLSNADCSKMLPKFVQSGANRLVLAHLSEENNTAKIAMDEAIKALLNSNMKRDIDFTLDIAPVETNKKSVIF